MADIDNILERLNDDPAFRDAVRSDPGSALKEHSLSTDDLARVQDALGPTTPSPSVESLFGNGASGAGRAGLIGLLVPALAVVGLVVGFAGGAAGMAGGSSHVVAAPLTPVTVSDCPGGVAVGTLHRGDRVLVTGRDDTGNYVEIRDAGNLDNRVWVATSAVVVPNASDLAGVDVRPLDPACKGAALSSPPPLPGGDPSASVDSTTIPLDASSSSASSSSSSSAASTTTPASTPTTAADHTPPSIEGTNASPTEIWENYAPAGGLCTTQTTTVVSAKVTDASGLSAVTLSWTIGKSSGSSAMSPVGATYRATLGPFPYQTVPDGTIGQINVTITATDTHGNTSTTSISVPLHSASECIG